MLLSQVSFLPFLNNLSALYGFCGVFVFVNVFGFLYHSNLPFSFTELWKKTCYRRVISTIFSMRVCVCINHWIVEWFFRYHTSNYVYCKLHSKIEKHPHLKIWIALCLAHLQYMPFFSSIQFTYDTLHTIHKLDKSPQFTHSNWCYIFISNFGMRTERRQTQSM